MERVKHIVLITSGQPTTNPRLVKEADALSKSGYEVTVIYQYISNWATLHDSDLINQSSWNAIETGGNPKVKRRLYYWTRIFYKLAQIIAERFTFKFGWAELAIGRCYFSLLKSAKKINADLYIAHNLAALPVAVKAAKKNNAKVGFDAEDYHRHEVSDSLADIDVRIKTYLEEKYIPLTDFLTSSSSEIAKKYRQIFEKDVCVILNVFPKSTSISQPNTDKPLKLFWFSQTIGPNRGIEAVIEALNMIPYDFELHLLGREQEGFLSGCYKKANFNLNQIHVHNPIASSRLIEFSSRFDVGLATETGFSINNELALSNKIFTYIQSGIAVVASDTVSQKQLLNKYPEIGLMFNKNDPGSLATTLVQYFENPALMNEHKQNSFKIGQEILNWDLEAYKFLSIVSQTLSN